jgi:hypothetical protein
MNINVMARRPKVPENATLWSRGGFEIAKSAEALGMLLCQEAEKASAHAAGDRWRVAGPHWQTKVFVHFASNRV